MTVTSIIPRIRGYAACRFCGAWSKPADLTGGACRTCVRDNLDWLRELGIRLAVPLGFHWPRA